MASVHKHNVVTFTDNELNYTEPSHLDELAVDWSYFDKWSNDKTVTISYQYTPGVPTWGYQRKDGTIRYAQGHEQDIRAYPRIGDKFVPVDPAVYLHHVINRINKSIFTSNHIKLEVGDDQQGAFGNIHKKSIFLQHTADAIAGNRCPHISNPHSAWEANPFNIPGFLGAYADPSMGIRFDRIVTAKGKRHEDHPSQAVKVTLLAPGTVGGQEMGSFLFTMAKHAPANGMLGETKDTMKSLIPSVANFSLPRDWPYGYEFEADLPQNFFYHPNDPKRKKVSPKVALTSSADKVKLGLKLKEGVKYKGYSLDPFMSLPGWSSALFDVDNNFDFSQIAVYTGDCLVSGFIPKVTSFALIRDTTNKAPGMIVQVRFETGISRIVHIFPEDYSKEYYFDQLIREEWDQYHTAYYGVDSSCEFFYEDPSATEDPIQYGIVLPGYPTAQEVFTPDKGSADFQVAQQAKDASSKPQGKSEEEKKTSADSMIDKLASPTKWFGKKGKDANQDSVGSTAGSGVITFTDNEVNTTEGVLLEEFTSNWETYLDSESKESDIISYQYTPGVPTWGYQRKDGTIRFAQGYEQDVRAYPRIGDKFVECDPSVYLTHVMKRINKNVFTSNHVMLIPGFDQQDTFGAIDYPSIFLSHTSDAIAGNRCPYVNNPNSVWDANPFNLPGFLGVYDDPSMGIRFERIVEPSNSKFNGFPLYGIKMTLLAPGTVDQEVTSFLFQERHHAYTNGLLGETKDTMKSLIHSVSSFSLPSHWRFGYEFNARLPYHFFFHPEDPKFYRVTPQVAYTSSANKVKVGLKLEEGAEYQGVSYDPFASLPGQSSAVFRFDSSFDFSNIAAYTGDCMVNGYTPEVKSFAIIRDPDGNAPGRILQVRFDNGVTRIVHIFPDEYDDKYCFEHLIREEWEQFHTVHYGEGSCHFFYEDPEGLDDPIADGLVLPGYPTFREVFLPDQGELEAGESAKAKMEAKNAESDVASEDSDALNDSSSDTGIITFTDNEINYTKPECLDELAVDWSYFDKWDNDSASTILYQYTPGVPTWAYERKDGTRRFAQGTEEAVRAYPRIGDKFVECDPSVYLSHVIKRLNKYVFTSNHVRFVVGDDQAESFPNMRMTSIRMPHTADALAGTRCPNISNPDSPWAPNPFNLPGFLGVYDDPSMGIRFERVVTPKGKRHTDHPSKAVKMTLLSPGAVDGQSKGSYLFVMEDHIPTNGFLGETKDTMKTVRSEMVNFEIPRTWEYYGQYGYESHPFKHSFYVQEDPNRKSVEPKVAMTASAAKIASALKLGEGKEYSAVSYDPYFALPGFEAASFDISNGFDFSQIGSYLGEQPAGGSVPGVKSFALIRDKSGKAPGMILQVRFDTGRTRIVHIFTKDYEFSGDLYSIRYDWEQYHYSRMGGDSFTFYSDGDDTSNDEISSGSIPVGYPTFQEVFQAPGAAAVESPTSPDSEARSSDTAAPASVIDADASEPIDPASEPSSDGSNTEIEKGPDSTVITFTNNEINYVQLRSLEDDAYDYPHLKKWAADKPMAISYQYTPGVPTWAYERKDGTIRFAQGYEHAIRGYPRIGDKFVECDPSVYLSHVIKRLNKYVFTSNQIKFIKSEIHCDETLMSVEETNIIMEHTADAIMGNLNPYINNPNSEWEPNPFNIPSMLGLTAVLQNRPDAGIRFDAYVTPKGNRHSSHPSHTVKLTIYESGKLGNDAIIGEAMFTMETPIPTNGFLGTTKDTMKTVYPDRYPHTWPHQYSSGYEYPPEPLYHSFNSPAEHKVSKGKVSVAMTASAAKIASALKLHEGKKYTAICPSTPLDLPGYAGPTFDIADGFDFAQIGAYTGDQLVNGPVPGVKSFALLRQSAKAPGRILQVRFDNGKTRIIVIWDEGVNDPHLIRYDWEQVFYEITDYNFPHSDEPSDLEESKQYNSMFKNYPLHLDVFQPGARRVVGSSAPAAPVESTSDDSDSDGFQLNLWDPSNYHEG